MIDVNYGLSGGVNTIDSIINQYATPEVASQDMFFNAPRGRDYLIDQYQQLSGNSFLSDHGDPFEEASRARASALTTAAVQPNRPIIATGSNMGMRALPSPVDPNLSVAYAHARGEAATPLEAETARMGAGIPNLAAAWSHPEANLDAVADPNSPDFLNAQKTRVSSLGSDAMSLFDTLRSTSPTALAPTSRISPKLQRDEKGKVVAGDVLNSDLFSHPDFQKMIKEKPEKAKQFYAAVTGRDLDQDVGMQVASNQKRQVERDRVLANLADKIDFDEITGKPYIREYVAGLMPGERKEVRRSLSYVEQQMMSQEGGFKTRFGFPAPSGAPELGKATPAAKEAIKTLVDQDRSNDPLSTKIARARKHLIPPPPSVEPTGPNKLLQAGTGIANFMRAGVNLPIGMINELLRAKGIVRQTDHATEGFLPTFEDIDPRSVAEEYANMPRMSDVLAETRNYYSRY